MKLLMKRLKI